MVPADESLKLDDGVSGMHKELGLVGWHVEVLSWWVI